MLNNASVFQNVKNVHIDKYWLLAALWKSYLFWASFGLVAVVGYQSHQRRTLDKWCSKVRTNPNICRSVHDRSSSLTQNPAERINGITYLNKAEVLALTKPCRLTFSIGAAHLFTLQDRPRQLYMALNDSVRWQMLAGRSQLIRDPMFMSTFQTPKPLQVTTPLKLEKR